jgi:hypothetical protein
MNRLLFAAVVLASLAACSSGTTHPQTSPSAIQPQSGITPNLVPGENVLSGEGRGSSAPR